MTFIDNLRDSWKFAMTWVNSAWVIAWAIWLAQDAEKQAAWVAALGLNPTIWLPLIGVAGVEIARRIKQPALHQPQPQSQVNPGV